MIKQQDILKLYSNTGLKDKLHIKIRAKALQMDVLDSLVPKKGNILDFGCGHGLVSTYLAFSSQNRKILGIDIDERKIDIAIKNPGNALKNISFETFNGNYPKQVFDAVIILDVLYLMKYEDQENFIKYAYSHLSNNGVLLIKETQKSRSWKYLWGFAEEKVMTSLGLTKGNKKLFYRQKDEYTGVLRKAGFRVEIFSPATKLPDYNIFICKK